MDRASSNRRFSRRAFSGLIDSLESAVKGLRSSPLKTEWTDYYDGDSYSQTAFNHKIELATGFLNEIRPTSVWDLGSNTGEFGRLAGNLGIQTIAFDQDQASVEQSYKTSVDRNETNVLPLVLDLLNPSPKIGWANSERMDLIDRGTPDMLMALALIHHLAIAQNLPLGMIADFFRKMCQWAVVDDTGASVSKISINGSLITGLKPIIEKNKKAVQKSSE